MTLDGRTIADTRDALTLQEASYPAVLAPSDASTHRPYKGDASYYGLKTAAGVVSPAVWTYAAPHDAVAAIGDHVAFYPDKVDAVEVHTEG